MNESFTGDFSDLIIDKSGDLLRFLAWIVGLPLVLWVVCGLVAVPLGTVWAWYDVSQGHYEVHGKGLIHPYLSYKALLKERYNITFSSNCICTFPETPGETLSNSYSITSRNSIIAKFGKDVFAECMQDAKTYTEEEDKRLYHHVQLRKRAHYLNVDGDSEITVNTSTSGAIMAGIRGPL